MCHKVRKATRSLLWKGCALWWVIRFFSALVYGNSSPSMYNSDFPLKNTMRETGNGLSIADKSLNVKYPQSPCIIHQIFCSSQDCGLQLLIQGAILEKFCGSPFHNLSAFLVVPKKSLLSLRKFWSCIRCNGFLHWWNSVVHRITCLFLLVAHSKFWWSLATGHC